MLSRPTPPIPQWQVLGLLLAVLLLCYSTVLFSPYAFFDDYMVLANSLTGQAKGSQNRSVAEGRPIFAFLMRFLYAQIRTTDDVRYIRVLTVILIAVLAGVIYRALLGAGWSWFAALCLSLIVVTMPPFQICASWALAVGYPLAALAAAGAFYLARQAFNAQSLRGKWGHVIASVLCILVSVTTVQPATMFFWIFAIIHMFPPEERAECVGRQFLCYCLVNLAGLILGFGVYKVGLTLYPYVLSEERSHLTTDVLSKAIWFVRLPLKDSLNLINLSPSSAAAVCAAAFISGGMCLYLRGSLWERIRKLAIALAIIPLSYLPNLVTAENWSSYRTQLALVSVVTLYAGFAWHGYVRALPGRAATFIATAALALCAFVSIFLAAYNVDTYFALPQFLELRVIRSQLAQADFSRAREIYVIGSSWKDSIAPQVRYDEFGLPSSAQGWALAPAVYLVFREMHPAQDDIAIEVAPDDAPVKPPPPNAVVVDMRKLRDFGL